ATRSANGSGTRPSGLWTSWPRTLRKPREQPDEYAWRSRADRGHGQPVARGRARARDRRGRDRGGGRGGLPPGRLGGAVRGGHRRGGGRDARAALRAAHADPRRGQEGQGEAAAPAAERLLAPALRGAQRDRQPGLLPRRAPAGARAPAGRPAGRTPRRAPLPGPGRGPAPALPAAPRRRPVGVDRAGPGDPEAPGGSAAADAGIEGQHRARHPETHPGAPHRPIGETLMSTVETAGTCTAILDELERAVVGRRRTLELVLIGILAGGHVLLEDLPGLGKTLIARSFARVLGLEFARIQFTPDLLPSDVTGAPLYDQRSAEMVFRPGPVFTQLLLADEINRTPPKTQAALLEAMGEGQVSVDGQSRKLPAPFVVLATDNPIEYEGTYELPEAQLDRFLMRLRLGYLSSGDETAMLTRRVERAREEVELAAVTSAEGVLAMRETLEQVEITPDLLDYIVAIVGATRRNPQVQVGASPRGGLALVQLARGQALLSKRDYVVPDDIKQVAVPALAHRLTLRPELWVRQVSSDDVMAKLLSSVPTPRTDPARAQATAVTG